MTQPQVGSFGGSVSHRPISPIAYKWKQIYVPLYGNRASRLSILVPLVFSGGLGSCTHCKTQKPPILAAFVLSPSRIEIR